MTAPLLRIATWRRFHPLARYGYGVTREGLRTRNTPRVVTGVAFVAAGLVLRRYTDRKIRRKPSYRADLEHGESMRIRVLTDGVEVDVIDVPEA